MERLDDNDDELKEYEGLGEHAHNVPQDGVIPRPPASKDPEEFPARKQPPAHRGFGTMSVPAAPSAADAHAADGTGDNRPEPATDDGTDREPDTKLWDEASQRYMEGVGKDRKQATEADYHDTPKSGSGVRRGDTSADEGD